MGPSEEARLNLMWGMPQTDYHLLRDSKGFCASNKVQEAYDRRTLDMQDLAIVRTKLESSRDFKLTKADIDALQKEKAKLIHRIKEASQIIKSEGSGFN